MALYIDIFYIIFYNVIMKTVTLFLAGETAPTAIVAEAGGIVPNHHGNIALQGFMADPLDSSSEARLDTSVEPPVLHLINALTKTLFGYTDVGTGEFVNFTHEMPHAHHLISGVYSGPGSELELR